MLADRLKEVRKARGINQQEVADYLGVKRQTYSAYERAISVPDSLVLKKLADYFGISIEEFFLSAKDNSDEAYEQQLMVLARKSRKIPIEQREKLIKNFEENLGLYLDAMDLAEVRNGE